MLILDEPTNDLDLETLSVLEAELADFPGTILVVSHDRAFLENVVTSTWLFEGDGRIEEYVGHRLRALDDSGRRPCRWAPSRPSRRRTGSPARRKLAYKEQREFEALPGRIEALETEERAAAVTHCSAGVLQGVRGGDPRRSRAWSD